MIAVAAAAAAAAAATVAATVAAVKNVGEGGGFNPEVHPPAVR